MILLIKGEPLGWERVKGQVFKICPSFAEKYDTLGPNTLVLWQQCVLAGVLYTYNYSALSVRPFNTGTKMQHGKGYIPVVLKNVMVLN